MNDGLKQRIIGALVLTALCVIFVPVMFDQKRIEPVSRTSLIPPEPPIDSVPVPDVVEVDIERDVLIASPISGDFTVQEGQNLGSIEANAEKKNESIAGETDTKTHVPQSRTGTKDSTQKEADDLLDAKVQAWVLQVASFRDEKRALEMRDELNKMGYKTRIKNMDTNSGVRSRVLVGPSINKPALEDAKRKLDKKYKLNSMLFKFSP